MVQHALRKKCHGGRLLVEDEDVRWMFKAEAGGKCHFLRAEWGLN